LIIVIFYDNLITSNVSFKFSREVVISLFNLSFDATSLATVLIKPSSKELYSNLGDNFKLCLFF